MARWGTRKVKVKKKKIVFISLILFLIISFETFVYIEKQLEPILMSIAQARVKQIATNAVNEGISKKIAQNNNFEDLIKFETDNEGRIRAAIFNYSEFARIVGESTANVENTLKNLENLEERIKLGALFNSDILADFGPSIPISIVPVGSVQVTPITTYQNAGINVTIMTVLINIRAEVRVVIPFVTEPTVIESAIPIAQTQIFGEVPQFYYDGKGTYYNQSPTNTQSVPPIQIVPAAPTIPGSGQIEVIPETIPSISDDNNGIPGFEQFYPIIPREAVPSSG